MEIAESWQMTRLEDDVYSFRLIFLQAIVGLSVSAREESILRDNRHRWRDQTPTAENDGSTPPVPIPSINLQGYSPNVMMEPPTVVAAVSDQSEAITEPAVVSFPPPLESDSQAAVDYITDSLLPLSESVIPPPTTLVTNELEIPHDQPFIFSSIPSFPITSNPPLLPVHTLSSVTPPPSPPSSTALLSPTTISFASDLALASVVVSLAAVRAHLSNSYIAKKQAALFNSPLISLPPAFFDNYH
ncbi:hypothetical protein YC2023_061543 [Brassica napus]